MKTSVDILTGLIAVKELEIRTLKDRVTFLQNTIVVLQQENDELYVVIAKEKLEEVKGLKTSPVGFKNLGK